MIPLVLLLPPPSEPHPQIWDEVLTPFGAELYSFVVFAYMESIRNLYYSILFVGDMRVIVNMFMSCCCLSHEKPENFSSFYFLHYMKPLINCLLARTTLSLTLNNLLIIMTSPPVIISYHLYSCTLINYDWFHLLDATTQQTDSIYRFQEYYSLAYSQ